ncbi:MAG: c-type cytochrome [Lautropia sp.]|nr:c-type cytochrome [Lautropia sp.]
MMAPEFRLLRHAMTLTACLGAAGAALAASPVSGNSLRQSSTQDQVEQAVSAAGPDADRLLRANNCTGCHQTDRKLVGPAFRAVARRHAGEPEAVERLKKSIRQGGGGRWGPIPMPPYPAMKDEELQAIAEWIINLR